jgi:hypothetical protein
VRSTCEILLHAFDQHEVLPRGGEARGTYEILLQASINMRGLPGEARRVNSVVRRFRQIGETATSGCRQDVCDWNTDRLSASRRSRRHRPD